MSTWDCVSCGAGGQAKPYCEACGAAQPMEGDDTALSLVLGLVCQRCDAYNDPGVAACASCGAPLGDPTPAPMIEQPPAVAAAAPLQAPASLSGDPPSWMQAPTGQPLATAFALPKVDLSELKKSAQSLSAPVVTAATSGPAQAPAPVAPALCTKCRVPLEVDDKFCRNCGTRVGDAPALHTMQIPAARPLPGLPSPVLGAGVAATAMMPAFRSVNLDAGAGLGPHAAGPSSGPSANGPSATMVFGAVTAERSAKLVLVRGQSSFGTQWRLQAGETLIGRSEGAVLFPDDSAMAARHARLSFIGNDLLLEPLPSKNGVFVRVKEPTRLEPGDEVVLGAERLIVLGDDARPTVARPDDGAGTKLLGSLVKPHAAIVLLRVAADPVGNEVFHRTQRLLTLGRNHCDVNFPRDSFVSERHAQLSRTDAGVLLLEDLRSRNGTYLRARKPTRLVHGDLILMGDKVLRIELPQR